jgi:hypothetical protein
MYNSLNGNYPCQEPPTFRTVKQTIIDAVCDNYICHPRNAKQITEELRQAAAWSPLLYRVSGTEFLRCAISGLKHAGADASVLAAAGSVYAAALSEGE